LPLLPRRLRAFGALSLRPLSAIAALFARLLDALSLRYLSAFLMRYRCAI